LKLRYEKLKYRTRKETNNSKEKRTNPFKWVVRSFEKNTRKKKHQLRGGGFCVADLISVAFVFIFQRGVCLGSFGTLIGKGRDRGNGGDLKKVRIHF